MSNERTMRRIQGLPTARGFASGPVFVYRGEGDVTVPEYAVEPGREGDELLRLRRAVAETRRDIQNLITILKGRTGREDVQVFEGHLMLLEDEELTKETVKYIEEYHVNAEAAIRRTTDHARAIFGQMNDPYFRERIRDFDDVERRLLKALIGFGGSSQIDLKIPSIVVAEDLTPSETVQLPRDLVLGFATNGGSTTSHVALLARAMGIPAVTGLGDITSAVTPGETVLLDGTSGTVTVNPDEKTSADFSHLVERQREMSVEAARGKPAGTLREGGEVRVCANLHPGVPLDGVRDCGARGIGLYRSEYLWLNAGREPTEEEQFSAYREAARFAATLGEGASLTIRALDIGGDKTVAGISAKESNPFLGNRSIRYLLSKRDVFRTQLRAILRASAFGRTCVLYPMISCLEELRESAAELQRAKDELKARGEPFDEKIPVGVMIEVPSAALLADSLAREVDFFSIGTNDLVQYTMAADRGNESVAHLYQPTNPAVLRLVRMTIDAAKRNGIRIGVCGESASDPVAGILWAAMGVEMLSMSATYIPAISRILSRLSRTDLDAFGGRVRELCDTATGPEIYASAREWLCGVIPDFEEIIR